MKLAYQRTYAQFADSYLTTHYASGVRSMGRLLGGPLGIVVGALLFFLGRNPERGIIGRGLLIIVGLALALYSLYITLRPFIDLVLVWFRRDDFLGGEGQTVTLEIGETALHAQMPEGEFSIDFKNILTVQHRTDAAWIVTNGDQVIQVPRDNLLEGDHDAFIEKLFLIVFPPKVD